MFSITMLRSRAGTRGSIQPPAGRRRNRTSPIDSSIVDGWSNLYVATLSRNHWR